MICRV